MWNSIEIRFICHVKHQIRKKNLLKELSGKYLLYCGWQVWDSKIWIFVHVRTSKHYKQICEITPKSISKSKIHAHSGNNRLNLDSLYNTHRSSTCLVRPSGICGFPIWIYRQSSTPSTCSQVRCSNRAISGALEN